MQKLRKSLLYYCLRSQSSRYSSAFLPVLGLAVPPIPLTTSVYRSSEASQVARWSVRLMSRRHLSAFWSLWPTSLSVAPPTLTSTATGPLPCSLH